MHKENECSELIDIFLDFGEAMMGAGGEIARIEDSIARMGTAYGAVKTNVFVITSSIELTMCFAQGGVVTRTRRIISPGNTDFEKLRKLNDLSRCCVASPLPVSQLRERVERICSKSAPRSKFYLGSILAAGGFALFFGGSILDALLSGAFAVFVCLMQERVSGLAPNKIFFLFIASLVTGIGICLANTVIPGLHTDKIIIGDIMLLVPGVAITNAVRDTLIGDTISGLVKLADSLVWATALAAGFMIAILLFAG